MFSTCRDVTFPGRSPQGVPFVCFLIIPVVVIVTQVDTLPALVTTPTTTVVPAKRRVQTDARPDLQQSSSFRRPSHPLWIPGERPTKL